MRKAPDAETFRPMDRRPLPDRTQVQRLDRMESRAAARRQRQRWASRNIRRLTSQIRDGKSPFVVSQMFARGTTDFLQVPKIIRERRNSRARQRLTPICFYRITLRYP